MIKVNFFNKDNSGNSIDPSKGFIFFLIFFVILSVIVKFHNPESTGTYQEIPQKINIHKSNYVINSEQKLGVALKGSSLLAEVMEVPRPETYRVVIFKIKCESGKDAVIEESGTRSLENCKQKEIYSTLISGKSAEITDAQIKKIIQEVEAL